MKKARVLVVDDSTVIRRLLTDALSADPAIEVIGYASNGKLALAKLPQLSPDLVTLDIEMPEMDGLATLRELRRSYPRLPVIMFSTLTEKGAVATINALSLGATDYVTKPSNFGSVNAAIENVRTQLIPKIKALCPGEATRPVAPASVAARMPLRPVPAAGPSVPPDVIAIGVSTGGPNALAEIFATLPGNLRAPIVIVQHMPPLFTNYLAQRLDSHSPISVCEAQQVQSIRPGGAWIAPGDFHMSLARNGIEVQTSLHQAPPENSCRPAVDVLFRSVAEIYGSRALAVVLTGMGQDGLRGCEAIRHAGGRVIVQDEASSVVWGMPGAVVRADLAHEILPLNRIAARIAQLAAPAARTPLVAGAIS
jgi:two-component system chemotaxis response regulator CheB